MAASYMASMLDELMGRNRDQPPDQKGKEKTWDDTQVCKHYLCGFCPNELFINTRADLGPCDKIHDDAYKKEYEESSRFEKMGYEEDFLRFLQSLLSDVERRIRRGHQRLALSTQPSGGASSFTSQKEEKVEMLTQRINDLVEQIEELGCEGKVEEAQGVMKLCDQLKEEREQLENRVEQHTVPSMKDMEVCDVCGAFLILGDAQQRLEEHLMGKQHMGFAKVRVTVENIKNKLRGRDAEREARLAKEREDREKEREREREERQLRREEREKEREKERERRKKKSRSRSRGRRSRSRSRTKKSRSRERERSRDRGDRDRDRGDRERERGRDHDRGDRDRDRDRDRRRRSRSRERHRSRSRDRHHRSRSRSRGHSRHSSSSKRRSRSKERRSHRSRSHEKRRERESKDRDSKHNETPEKESKSRDESSLNGDHNKEVEDSSNHEMKPVTDVAPMEEQITSAVPDAVAAPTEAAAGLVEGDSN